MRTLAVLFLLLPQNKLDVVYHYNTLKETRTKVAVIDTGIKVNKETKRYLCNGNHYDLTGEGIEDKYGHGTNVAGIIAKRINPQKTCILVIKYYGSTTYPFLTIPKAFRIAVKENAKYVNFSAGGPAELNAEKQAIQKLIKNQQHVLVAAGNSSFELTKRDCNYYPACYNFNSEYFRVVGNGKDGKPHQLSNYGEKVTDWRNGKDVEGFGIKMSGSSQSTAILTGEMAGKE
jgi:subtilisin family serine protease